MKYRVRQRILIWMQKLDPTHGDRLTRQWAERKGWIRHTLTYNWYLTDDNGNTALDDPRF